MSVLTNPFSNISPSLIALLLDEFFDDDDDLKNPVDAGALYSFGIFKEPVPLSTHWWKQVVPLYNDEQFRKRFRMTREAFTKVVFCIFNFLFSFLAFSLSSCWNWQKKPISWKRTGKSRLVDAQDRTLCATILPPRFTTQVGPGMLWIRPIISDSPRFGNNLRCYNSSFIFEEKIRALVKKVFDIFLIWRKNSCFRCS